MSDITSAIWMYKFWTKHKKREGKLTKQNLLKQIHAKTGRNTRYLWPCFHLEWWHGQKTASQASPGEGRGETGKEILHQKQKEQLKRGATSSGFRQHAANLLLSTFKIDLEFMFSPEITSKGWQNNLPFCWKCILTKETLPATTVKVIKGFHLKCIRLLTQRGELSPTRRFSSDCFWEAASLVREHFRIFAGVAPSHLAFSVKSTRLSLQPPLEEHLRVWRTRQDLGQSCSGISVSMDRTSPLPTSEKHLSDS